MPDVTGSSEWMELLIKCKPHLLLFFLCCYKGAHSEQADHWPAVITTPTPSNSLGGGNSLEALTTLTESVAYSQAASDKSCHFLNMKYKSLWLSTVVSGPPFETETELIPYILVF